MNGFGIFRHIERRVTNYENGTAAAYQLTVTKIRFFWITIFTYESGIL
jgi:hypothetical protein